MKIDLIIEQQILKILLEIFFVFLKVSHPVWMSYIVMNYWLNRDSIVIYEALFSCDTRPEVWGSQWDWKWLVIVC